MQKETAFIAVAALFSLLSSALAANLRYTAVDDVRSWDNVSAWKCEDGLYGSLPQPLDNVSIDSGTVALPNFLRVTNGVTAAAYTLKLGALDGDASYAQSGKIIAFKVESGGVLHTGKGEFDAISIGDRASGYGIVTIEGGMVSNQFITVGTKGIGVLTNDCGTIVQLGPELGSYGYLNVGFEQSATGTVVMTGGAITHLPSSSSWNNAIINVGRCGHGTFELSGGVISNRLMVGTSRSDIPGGGTGVFRMSGGILENRLFIGYKEGQDAGSGFAEITGGTVNGHVYVGQYGSGRLVVDGGTLNIPREKRYDSMHENPFYASGLSVGRNARSNGEFVFRSGTLNFAKNSNLVVGYNGAGSAEFFAEATVPYLRVGGSSAGGRLVVHDGVTLTVSCSMQVGGYPILENSSSDNDIVECVGTGLLVLTNATLRFLDGDDYGSFDNTSGQLSIGRYDGSYGVLRGCGMICGPDANSNNVRIWMDNGQIIADGFGKESELDLNTVISIRNNTADIASDTTNGWYAVDKGAALFPRVYFTGGSIDSVLGGWSGDTEPGFVNSVGVSISGVYESSSYLRGGFFASDRNDVHVDSLPSDANVIGIWKLGVTTEISGSVVRNFSSVDLDFRYDQTKVKLGTGIVLYRWNGTSWNRVAEKDADPTHRISVAGLERPASWDGIYDIGTFALVSFKPGLKIIVK